MKFFYVGLSCLSILFCKAQYLNYTDWRNYGFKGKVKSMTEDNYYAKRILGKIKYDEASHFGHIVANFKTNGMLSTSYCDCLNIDDTRGAEYVFLYNDSNSYLGYEKFNVKKEKTEYFITNYFKSNLLFGQTTKSNGTLSYDTIYYSIDFRDSVKITYEIDEKNKVFKTLTLYEYDSLGLGNLETYYKYKVKPNGDLKLDFLGKMIYKYTSFDEFGNWTSKEAINAMTEKIEQITIRKFEYYE